MKKVAVVVGSLLALGALAFVITYQKAKSHRIELPYVEPAHEPTTQLAQAFPGRSSTIVLTVRIPTAPLNELAEKAVPQSFQGEYSVPDMGGFSEIKVSPDLSREGLGLRVLSNAASPRVEIATRLSGTVNVKGVKEVLVEPDVKIGPFKAPPIKVKSPELSQNFDVDATIRGGITLDIDPNWNFKYTQDIKAEVKQADAKLFGLVPISLTNEVQKAADAKIPGFIDKALNSAKERWPLRAELEKVWQGMNQFVLVSSNPNTYVTITPQKVKLQEIRFDDPNYLSARIAIEGQIQTLVTNQTPEPPPSTALPPLIQKEKINPRFSVLLPVGVELSAINPKLRAAIAETKLDLGEDSTAVVKDLTLYSKNGVVYAKVQFEADNERLSAHVSGTIFLRAGLRVSQDPLELRLRDVDFCLETENVIAKTASWLSRKTICRRIEEQVRIDLTEPLEAVKTGANRGLAKLNVGPYMKLQPALTTVGFEGIRIHDNFIIVGIELSGDIRGEMVLEK